MVLLRAILDIFCVRTHFLKLVSQRLYLVFVLLHLPLFLFLSLTLVECSDRLLVHLDQRFVLLLQSYQLLLLFFHLVLCLHHPVVDGVGLKGFVDEFDLLLDLSEVFHGRILLLPLLRQDVVPIHGFFVEILELAEV